jgi:hypothetical protein
MRRYKANQKLMKLYEVSTVKKVKLCKISNWRDRNNKINCKN